MVSGSSLGDGAAARESEFARGRAELRPFQLAGNVTSHRLTEVQHFSSEGYKFYLGRLRDDDINVLMPVVGGPLTSLIGLNLVSFTVTINDFFSSASGRLSIYPYLY